MARTKGDVLAEILDAWSTGDEERLLALVHPDAELDMTVRVMNPEVYRGHEGLRRMRADMTELWDFGPQQVHRRLERGDELLLVHTTPMRGRASGVEFANPVAHRYRFAGWRVIHMKLLTDVERAVADFEAGRPAASR
jgi:ketosteroid isomerase-like protein